MIVFSKICFFLPNTYWCHIQRESAIANDCRRYTLKYESKAQVEAALQNIERK
jgi:hypothetical protein